MRTKFHLRFPVKYCPPLHRISRHQRTLNSTTRTSRPTTANCAQMCQDRWPVKVKWSRYRPGVTQRVCRGIALLFHDRGTRRGWVVSSTPRPHFTPGKDPVAILQDAGWTPGPVASTDINSFAWWTKSVMVTPAFHKTQALFTSYCEEFL